jgi:hypothetical protein
VLTAGAVLASGGLGLATTLAPADARAQSETAHDVTLLNGLLATEYYAIQAYEMGADVLNDAPASDPLVAIAPVALAVAAHFQGQHRDHATQLAAQLRAAGATPVTYGEVITELPPGFTPSVGNALRLAANGEKHAALLYAHALRTMNSQLAAELVASIGGVETQHFVVLSMLAQGIAIPTAMTRALANDVVPQSFIVQTASGTTGLEQVPDFDLG